MTEVPESRYTTVGGDYIAYQVFGEGAVDVLWVPASGDCVELRWDWPPYAKFLGWLGSRARVIAFDRRGTGASDAPSGERLPHWEQWADDARAVMDAAGSERAVIFGTADSGPAAILFAGSHPSRTRGLVLVNTHSRVASADHPDGVPDDEVAALSQYVTDNWGTQSLTSYVLPDSVDRDPLAASWFAKNMRMYMTPSAAGRAFAESTDVDEALALVRVPTLVLHRDAFAAVPVESGRYLAEHITGARLVVVPGRDSVIFTEPAHDALTKIDEFLRGLNTVDAPDRALAAILFTDIVGSTEHASALGDLAWRNLLVTHDAMARTLVDQHNGRVVKMTGDGMLAIFDGPGRAIRCATSMRDALRTVGLEIRAGLHTGEVEVIGDDIAGIGVHIASRILDASQPGTLFVSPAVPMLVAGAGFEFEDRGEQELKGVPGKWKLFTVKS
jgi:class 3 adenylate cyclase